MSDESSSASTPAPASPAPTKSNWFEANLHKAVDMFAAAGKFLKGILIDVWVAYYPILKGDMAKFVAQFKGVAMDIALAASKIPNASSVQKIECFAAEMGKEFVKRGIAEVRGNTLDHLRTVVVDELRNKGLIPLCDDAGEIKDLPGMPGAGPASC